MSLTTSGAVHKHSATNPRSETPEKHLVLVIDDDKKFSESVATTLEDVGYDALVAHDGNVGIAAAIAREPDMIILDSRMPKRSGFLVLEYLRTHTSLVCPTIFLCDCVGERHEAYARLLGADLYVPKPVNGNQLVKMVNVLLQQHSPAGKAG